MPGARASGWRAGRYHVVLREEPSPATAPTFKSFLVSECSIVGRMDKRSLRIWMILTAGMAGGLFALVGVVPLMAARIAFATLGGVSAGLMLYLYGKLNRA